MKCWWSLDNTQSVIWRGLIPFLKSLCHAVVLPRLLLGILEKLYLNRVENVPRVGVAQKSANYHFLRSLKLLLRS